MPCYHPLEVYRSRTGGITFSRSQAWSDKKDVKISCGQCIGCLLQRSLVWALRCNHEAQCHESNSFVTLTYNEENLPEGGTLVPDHFQKWLKRLRKRISPNKIRFFGCGEYGDKNSRPHYHALLFGYDFPDKKLHKVTRRGDRLYTSEELNLSWTNPDTKQPYGHALIGDLTFQSAAYVARYCTKKITGEKAATHYQNVDPYTGEINQLVPEFSRMSRRPGIGREWFQKYKSDVYPGDFCEINGKKMQPPAYYDKLHEELHEEAHRKIIRARKKNGLRYADDNTPERLKVREKVHQARAKTLKRSLETEESDD